MLALAVEYLSGRAVATRHSDYERAEWPPHPARLFSALVAAMHETGAAHSERSALLWLERQGPPALTASGARPRVAAAQRDTGDDAEGEEASVVAFVPVNDASLPRQVPGRALKRDDLGVLPEYRKRQERMFPSVTPHDPTVHLTWPEAALDPAVRAALASLLRKVPYLGHSSSPVSVRICGDPPPPTHVPDDDGDLVLRVPFEGLVEALDHAYEVHVRTGIRGRLPCAFQAYRRVQTRAAPSTVHEGEFLEMIVWRRREGPALPIEASLAVTAALRGAAMSASVQPAPEVLSGHQPDGRVSVRPHVAVVPLPDVGHRHADGHLLGAAAALPRGVAPDERRAILTALARISRLTMGTLGAWSVERVTAEATQKALRPETWCGPSRIWASVTPLLLDAFPDTPYGTQTEGIVARACERVGLPRPVEVGVGPTSAVAGAPPWHAYVAREQPGRPRRPHVHAVLRFGEGVRGPLLLGAGRYRGLGLCRPLPDRSRPTPQEAFS